MKITSHWQKFLLVSEHEVYYKSSLKFKNTNPLPPFSMQLVEARVQPTEYQKEVLDQLEAATGGDQEAESKKRKRKRPKGPNPLSVKKSKKMRQTGSSGGRSSKGSVSKNMVIIVTILYVRMLSME